MKKLISALPLFVALLLAIAGCDGDSEVDDNPAPDNGQPADTLAGSFDQVIATDFTFEEVPESRSVDTLSSEEPETEDREIEGESVEQRYVCSKKRVSVLDGNDQFPLFSTNADVIYPGNLLQYKSLPDATPSPIVVKRAGGSISYNLNNGNLSSSFTVDEVKKSTIQDGMNNIIANAGEVVPANFNLEIEEVQSEEQLALEMGLQVETFTTKVKGSMSFSSDRSYNRFLVKLTQQYYTMSFDLPTSLDEMFDENVTPDQLSTYVQDDNPATFISSVTYGRIYYMLVESTESSSEMRARLQASYGAFRNKVSGSVDVESFKSMSNVRLKVIAYGGDATGTFELSGEETIDGIAGQLANSTDIRAGLPLSYVVRSVERPDIIVGTKLATEYDVVNCQLIGDLPPAGPYKSLVDVFENGYGAMLHVANSNVLFFSKAGTEYVWFNGNLGVADTFSITDPDAPLGVVPLNSVGAAVRFTDDQFYIFDNPEENQAQRCVIASYTSSSYGGNAVPPGQITRYTTDDSGIPRIYFVNDLFGDSGNFRFNIEGFSAAHRLGASMIYFGSPGDEHAKYERFGNGTWSDPSSNDQLFPNADGGAVFERVGGASLIQYGGNSIVWLYIDAEGKKLQEFRGGSQLTSNGPWIID